MKKLIVLLLTVAIAVTCAACGGSSDAGTTTAATTTIAATTTTAPAPTYTAEEIAAAIREAYGENYLSNAPIPEEMLTDMFGMDLDSYESYVAEMPMIGFHPDRVIVVAAKDEASADATEEAFNAARDTLINDSMQYPANIAKINAAQVLRNGNYVVFLLAGAPDDVTSDEEAAAEFAKEQTQIGVDAFNALFA